MCCGVPHDLHHGFGSRRTERPAIPEIHQYNPEAVYIARTGQINAWDNPAWVEAIEKTKRKTLLIAGTLTSVCMAFPDAERPRRRLQGLLHR